MFCITTMCSVGQKLGNVSLVVFLSIVAFVSNSQAFKSDVFSYDDTHNAKGLHTCLGGKAKGDRQISWRAREVQEKDIPFHEDFFSDPILMSYFANGQPRTREVTRKKIQQRWIQERFQQGHPFGGLTVLCSVGGEERECGHIIIGKGQEPGVTALTYGVGKEFQGQKLASSFVDKVINVWAPEVRRIGMGIDLGDEEAKIKEAFLFTGQPLRSIYATASPANIPSWKILDTMGFKAAPVEVLEPIDLSAQGSLTPQQVNEYLESLYEPAASTLLQAGKRYRCILADGTIRTFSVHPGYKHARYHFEYNLVPRVDSKE